MLERTNVKSPVAWEPRLCCCSVRNRVKVMMSVLMSCGESTEVPMADQLERNWLWRIKRNIQYILQRKDEELQYVDSQFNYAELDGWYLSSSIVGRQRSHPPMPSVDHKPRPKEETRKPG